VRIQSCQKVPFSTKKRQCAEKTGKKRQKRHEISVNVWEVCVKFSEMNVKEV
jgi:hypothetical protein